MCFYKTYGIRYTTTVSTICVSIKPMGFAILPRLVQYVPSYQVIVVVVGNQVFQQSVGTLMGTNCAPLLADMFLHPYEAEFVQKLLHERSQLFAVAFNSTFRYIDDILSVNNKYGFHSYVQSIFPNNLEMKTLIIEYSTSTFYIESY
jgi:hypothetical protein